MPVFIELTTDAFAATFTRAHDAAAKARRAGVDRARRPLRGLEIKDDTYAFLKIVRADGTEIKLVDSSSETGESTQYSNFILQSVQEARMEKHQIVETFGEPYIYFFGEAPRFLDVQAVLVDSLDFNWYAEFWDNYNKYFRGTRSVELGARTYLFYDDNVVEGYVLMAQASKNADQPLQARLSFRMFLTNYSNVTFVGDPNFPVRASVNLPPSVNLSNADAFTVGLAAAGAATEAAIQEAKSIEAASGARQQAGGFGGGSKLSDALRSGVSSTGEPLVDGVLLNALRAIGNSGARTKPLRGLISDNFDEYTALLPPAIDLDEEERGEEDHDGNPEVEDFPTASTQQAQRYGANTNDPNMMARMGLGPRFTAQGGFGMVGGGAGATASFGVQRSASFGSTYYGGINGGLGFTGGFTAQASVGLQATAGVGVGVRANATVSLSATAGARQNALAQAQVLQQQILQKQFGGVYGNGVLVYGGIYQGTGIGGGIPNGVSGGIGPDGPGTLTMFTGGKGYKLPNGFAGTSGYGQGLSANGVGLMVGGAPSAFSTVAAPGFLQPNGYYGPYTGPIPGQYGLQQQSVPFPNQPLPGQLPGQQLLPGQQAGEQWPGQFAGAPPPLGTASGSFFIGPNGVSSNTNTTGIFV